MYSNTNWHASTAIRRGRAVPVLFAFLALVSCARPLPKPPAAVPPPPPRPVASRPTLHANWTFQTSPSACLAIANAGRSRLTVAVRRGQPIRLNVNLPDSDAGRAEARFHGPAGRWTVQGWPSGKHEIVFTLGRDMDSLSRVLMLLSGGVMDLQSPEKDLPNFSLSASGDTGRSWFGCARRLVI